MNGPDWPPGTFSEMVNPLDHLRYVPHHWPHCPICGRWIHPDLWPGHVGSHDTPAEPPPTEYDMHRAHEAHHHEEQPQ